MLDHPFVRAAAFCFLIVVAGKRGVEAVEREGQGRLRGPESRDALGEIPRRFGLSVVCPADSLPDGEVCVRIPDADEFDGQPLLAEQAAHVDRKGRYVVYDQIPRRPDRPADYRAYAFPLASGGQVGSGYDLDLPDSEQRRGRRLSHVGHGGIDLAAPRGTEVLLLRLEHQEGDAEVVFVGKLFGNSVVTRHVLRETGVLREYIVLYGHLDAAAAGMAAGQIVRDGSLLGYVGDSASEGIVHLHLEVRQVRSGVDLRKVAAQQIVANEVSVVCDPRNVLPVR